MSDSRDTRLDLVALLSAIVYVHATSSVVSGWPSCQRARGSSLNVYELASAAGATVASSGSILVLSGAASRSCEKTVAKYCACHGLTAWKGLTLVRDAPQ